MFVADESVDFRIVQHLRQRGIEIDAILEMEPSISDKEVLEIANTKNALILTEDKDFGELVFRLRLATHGVILIRLSDSPITTKLQKIDELILHYSENIGGSFTVITKDRIRIKAIQS
jgi:predicted nuclease of predicted toxin-antitoxin system